MPLHEFDIIKQYFCKTLHHSKDTAIGIGDDAAVVHIPKNHQLVTAIDTLVAGSHFLPNTSPEDIGHRALAVNLSDLAAMGAQPRFALLALTLPEANATWLAGFSNGLSKLAKQFQVDLIGGDITKGPLTISVAINGITPHGKAIPQGGAAPNDLIYVSNTVGDAGLALELIKNNKTLNTALKNQYYRPIPRIELGMALREIATSCIDISDGLAADLNKILTASNVGATMYLHKIPLSQDLQKHKNALNIALTSGDDYELCFTTNPNNSNMIEKIAKQLNIKITHIGNITANKKLIAIDAKNQEHELTTQGYQHF